METLKLIANGMIYIVIIVGLASVAYALIWSALFYPITKKRKHEEAVALANREYNKVQVELATIDRAKKESNDELKKLLFQIHYKNEELKRLSDDVAAKETEVKNTKTTAKKTTIKTTKK